MIKISAPLCFVSQMRTETGAFKHTKKRKIFPHRCMHRCWHTHNIFSQTQLPAWLAMARRNGSSSAVLNNVAMIWDPGWMETCCLRQCLCCISICLDHFIHYVSISSPLTTVPLFASLLACSIAVEMMDCGLFLSHHMYSEYFTSLSWSLVLELLPWQRSACRVLQYFLLSTVI